MKKIALPLLCLAAFAMNSAYARDPAFAAAEQTHMEMFLMTPPAPNSQTSKDELALLHHLEATRTPGQVAQAKADEANETMFIYKTVLGDKFTPENLPVTAAFAALEGRRTD